MKSAIVDLETGTATLPLRKGRMESGETVWSIMTDVSDQTSPTSMASFIPQN
jgi:hypothetical protein